MRDQPRYEVMEASSFFADGTSARRLVAGTVPWGALAEDDGLRAGRRGDQFVEDLPLSLDRALLERGQQRFNIYCAVCHAPSGDGDGMVVRRGFKQPPSFHSERLRNAPLGHFFDVITNGFGVMPSYRAQISPEDRWAIVAYVRVLQVSQHASADELTAAERALLDRDPR
jgi:mono/diheme cytochrome c family protein